MIDFHVTRNFLDALERGELARPKALGWLVDHVLSLCPVCRHEREAFGLECALGPSGQLAVTEPILSWLATVAPDFEGRTRHAEKSARRDFLELIALSPEARAGRIERSRRRFRHPELVELLLAEAHARIRSSPWEAHELAQLALEVSWQLEGAVPAGCRQEVVSLRARALLHSGNALRVQGQLVAAEREVAAARELIHDAAIIDLPVIAEIDWLEGVLRGALGQTDAALRLLERAILFSELTGDRYRAAVARLSLGALHQEKAQPERAAAAMYPIIDSIDEGADPLLALAARHNLTLCLCELGRFLEARQMFLRTEELYRRFDDFWTRLRRRWAEARIARGEGHAEHALDLLREVRDGFLAEDVRSDAAIASREIALVLLESKRDDEALEPARFALDVFAEQGVALELERTVELVERIENQLGLPPGPRPPLRPRTDPPTPQSSGHAGDVHVTREILRAQRTGRLAAASVTQLYLEHLPSLCPDCAPEPPPAATLDPAIDAATTSHGDALRRITLRLPLLVRRVQREEARARRRLDQLLALPHEERLAALDPPPSGATAFALAMVLVDAAQQVLASDDGEARVRAELALKIADRVEPSPEGPPRLAVAEVQARAHWIEGEALRRGLRLTRAEQSFAAARAVTRELGMLDPALQADLDFAEGLLRRDQGRLPAAIRLFRRSALQFRAIRASESCARSQIEHGTTLRQAGEVERGLEVLLEALANLEPNRPGTGPLAALAHHHAALASFELGRDRDARYHLEARRERIDALSPQDREQLSLPIAVSSD
jgi:tetratricopeptide (TPR) repeat protein